MSQPGEQHPTLTNEQDPRRLFEPGGAEQWRQAAEQLLRKPLAEVDLTTPTPEGITLRPIYHPGETEPLPLGPPAVETDGDPWLVAQALPAEDPVELNRMLKHDLARGQNCLNLQLDPVTRWRGEMPPAAVRSGSGVRLPQMRDWLSLLDGIDLTATPLFIQAYSAGLPLTAFLLEACRERGIDYGRLQGAVECDPLGELARSGSLPLSLEQAWAEMTALEQWAATTVPGLLTIGVHTEMYHNAGGTAVTDLAFALATGIEYLRRLEERGLPVAQTAPRLLFSFGSGPHFYMEIAKLRAARLLWRQVVTGCGCDTDAAVMHLRAVTASWNLTVTDRHVNILRNTTAALAAVLGGCDSLQTGYYDTGQPQLALLDRRLARNLQLVLRHEAGLERVQDPAAGSYLIESLTHDLAEKAWSLFQEIERSGGMTAALQAGYPQSELDRLAAQRRRDIATGRYRLVGTSMHALAGEELTAAPTEPEPAETAPPRSDESAVPPWDAAEDELAYCRQAVTAGATLTELCRALLQPGQNPAVTPVAAFSAGTDFERIRRITQDLNAAETGVLMILLSDSAPLRARRGFVTGALQTGGFQISGELILDDEAELPAQYATAAERIVLLCGSDDDYTRELPRLGPLLKETRPAILLLLAGSPDSQEAVFRKAGIDHFLHRRTDLPQLFEALLAEPEAEA